MALTVNRVFFKFFAFTQGCAKLWTINEKCDININLMDNTPFYFDGLRFSCKKCSTCCRYDAGYVYLTKNDLEKLLSALNMDKNSFLNGYCRWVTKWNGDEVLSLKEKPNKDCILWEDGCKVYDKRPIQCENFPFWEPILAAP